MDKIPLLSLIFYSIPEGIVLIYLSSALYGYNFTKNFKKVVLYSITAAVASYYIREQPLPIGAVIGIQLAVYILLAAVVLKLSLAKSTIFILTAIAFLSLVEGVISPFLLMLIGKNHAQAIRDPILRTVIPWVNLTILTMTGFFIRKKNDPISSGQLDPKSNSGKMILWLISLILLQAILGVTIYWIFYVKAFSDTQPLAFFETRWVTHTLAVFLVALPAVSVFMVGRLFKLVEKENIIASQEAFIDNINNLFNTIRAQRHDFLNHVQILDSYLKLGKVAEAKSYMAEILEETREINEFIIVKNPILNALIQAKMGVAQRYKIDFILDIQSSLSQISVKPFDLVKILGNLLNNAIEAVKDLESEYRTVKLSTKESDNNYTIEVFNPRPVIPPKAMTRIFEGGYTTKQGPGNCGVGLSVVKKLTDKYRGTVAVHSSEAEGTTFVVNFPVKK